MLTDYTKSRVLVARARVAKLRGLAKVAWVAKAIGVTLTSLTIIMGCSKKNESKPVLEQEVERLSVGMCFDDASVEDTVKDANSAIDTTVTNIPIVSCTEPHQNEIYYIYNLPDDEGYLETEASIKEMLQVCQNEFENLSSSSELDSSYQLSVLTPSSDSWQQGDKQVVCYVSDPENKKLVRPLHRVN